MACSVTLRTGASVFNHLSSPPKATASVSSSLSLIQKIFDREIPSAVVAPPANSSDTLKELRALAARINAPDLTGEVLGCYYRLVNASGFAIIESPHERGRWAEFHLHDHPELFKTALALSILERMESELKIPELKSSVLGEYYQLTREKGYSIQESAHEKGKWSEYHLGDRIDLFFQACVQSLQKNAEIAKPSSFFARLDGEIYALEKSRNPRGDFSDPLWGQSNRTKDPVRYLLAYCRTQSDTAALPSTPPLKASAFQRKMQNMTRKLSAPIWGFSGFEETFDGCLYQLARSEKPDADYSDPLWAKHNRTKDPTLFLKAYKAAIRKFYLSNEHPTDHCAAGVLPYARYQGRTYFLLGKESGSRVWCDFGGLKDRGESSLKTAARELVEESRGVLGSQSGIEARISSQMPLQTPVNRGSYYTYLHEVPFDPSLPSRFSSVRPSNRSEMEKTEIAWLDAQKIFAAIPAMGRFTHEGKPQILRDAFIRTIFLSKEQIQQSTGLSTAASASSQRTNASASSQRTFAAGSASSMQATAAKTCKKALVVIGGAGSGKNTVLKQVLKAKEEEGRFELIDADLEKEKIPAYQAAIASGSPNAASLVHAQSLDARNKSFDRAIRLRKNIAFVGTGTATAFYQNDVIGRLQREGYEVSLLFVRANKAVAKARVQKRAALTGRVVPAHVVESTNRNVERSFQALSRIANHVAVFNNNADDRPARLESGSF